MPGHESETSKRALETQPNNAKILTSTEEYMLTGEGEMATSNDDEVHASIQVNIHFFIIF